MEREQTLRGYLERTPGVETSHWSEEDNLKRYSDLADKSKREGNYEFAKKIGRALIMRSTNNLKWDKREEFEIRGFSMQEILRSAAEFYNSIGGGYQEGDIAYSEEDEKHKFLDSEGREFRLSLAMIPINRSTRVTVEYYLGEE